MKLEKNPLALSLLISQNKCDEHEITYEDLRYKHSPRVSECQVKLYRLVISLLGEGKSYDEIISIIDNIDIEEFKKLKDNEKDYVKSRVKRDVDSRKNNNKIKGANNNE